MLLLIVSYGVLTCLIPNNVHIDYVIKMMHNRLLQCRFTRSFHKNILWKTTLKLCALLNIHMNYLFLPEYICISYFIQWTIIY